jgi:hypothetical protein
LRTRSTLLVMALLALASSASAAWYPVFQEKAVSVNVGETATLRMTLGYTGLGWPPTPWMDAPFESTDPTVAATGDIRFAATPLDIPITGVTPGEAGIYLRGYSSNRPLVTVIVQCGSEPGLVNATPVVQLRVGSVVALRVVTPIADRTSFAWFHGRTGDTTWPIAAVGPEIAYATNDAGSHHVWVRATTPCSTSTAEFQVDAVNPRRRGARH